MYRSTPVTKVSNTSRRQSALMKQDRFTDNVTMSSLIGDLTGHTFHLPVVLPSHMLIAIVIEKNC